MDLTHEIKSLVEVSKTAMEHAYAPCSGFKVGAAVLGSSGEIYTGCNVENASYGLSTCAERAAIFRAICEGERAIRAVAISNSSGKAAFPCGACLQVMAEFAPAGEAMNIYLVSDQGVETHTLADLLPHAFRLETRP